jgi:hypothetical protein
MVTSELHRSLHQSPRRGLKADDPFRFELDGWLEIGANTLVHHGNAEFLRQPVLLEHACPYRLQKIG